MIGYYDMATGECIDGPGGHRRDDSDGYLEVRPALRLIGLDEAEALQPPGHARRFHPAVLQAALTGLPND